MKVTFKALAKSATLICRMATGVAPTTPSVNNSAIGSVVVGVEYTTRKVSDVALAWSVNGTPHSEIVSGTGAAVGDVVVVVVWHSSPTPSLSESNPHEPHEATASVWFHAPPPRAVDAEYLHDERSGCSNQDDAHRDASCRKVKMTSGEVTANTIDFSGYRDEQELHVTTESNTCQSPSKDCKLEVFNKPEMYDRVITCRQTMVAEWGHAVKRRQCTAVISECITTHSNRGRPVEENATASSEACAK